MVRTPCEVPLLWYKVPDLAAVAFARCARSLSSARRLVLSSNIALRRFCRRIRSLRSLAQNRLATGLAQQIPENFGWFSFTFIPSLWDKRARKWSKTEQGSDRISGFWWKLCQKNLDSIIEGALPPQTPPIQVCRILEQWLSKSLRSWAISLMRHNWIEPLGRGLCFLPRPGSK